MGPISHMEPVIPPKADGYPFEHAKNHVSANTPITWAVKSHSLYVDCKKNTCPDQMNDICRNYHPNFCPDPVVRFVHGFHQELQFLGLRQQQRASWHTLHLSLTQLNNSMFHMSLNCFFFKHLWKFWPNFQKSKDRTTEIPERTLFLNWCLAPSWNLNCAHWKRH